MLWGLASNLADNVLAAFTAKGVFISGVKVSVQPDDGTEPLHTRKAFVPGQRRQYPGKFGKKPRGATSGRKAYEQR